MPFLGEGTVEGHHHHVVYEAPDLRRQSLRAIYRLNADRGIIAWVYAELLMYRKRIEFLLLRSSKDFVIISIIHAFFLLRFFSKA